MSMTRGKLTKIFNKPLQQRLAAEIEKILPRIVALRRQLHQRPEPTWQEYETSKKVASTLRSIEGIEVREGVGKLGVVGLLTGAEPGPTIALRADMDALTMDEKTGLPYVRQRTLGASRLWS